MASANTNEFEALYKEHYPLLRRITRQMIGDEDASHDVVQDVFIKLWPKRNALEEIRDKRAYLVRSSIHASIDYLERTKKRLSPIEEVDKSKATSGDTYEHKELEALVEEVVNDLPPKCKAIFVLSRFENLKNKEIAEALQLSIKTVENQMGIAIKKIRAGLGLYL